MVYFLCKSGQIFITSCYWGYLQWPS